MYPPFWRDYTIPVKNAIRRTDTMYPPFWRDYTIPVKNAIRRTDTKITPGAAPECKGTFPDS